MSDIPPYQLVTPVPLGGARSRKPRKRNPAFRLLGADQMEAPWNLGGGKGPLLEPSCSIPRPHYPRCSNNPGAGAGVSKVTSLQSELHPFLQTPKLREASELAPRSLDNPLHPPMPTPHEAEKQHTGSEEADRPPSMSSHDAVPPAAPSRNPCCLCWCCCCSCSWNQERRRVWQASRESKLQPLPSCEVCTTPSPEEVQSWAQSFDKLMHSPSGRSVFRAFLRTEYSEENMLFWLACEELKAEANQHVVDEKARLIYEDYVSILSPKEVSLDSRVREGINRKMQEPSAHTFDDAQLQIYTLMHRDSYPRFLSSPTYRALLLREAPQASSEA